MSIETLREQYKFPPECPAIDAIFKGWRTWDKQFAELLPCDGKHIIIEVGVWFGKTSKILLELYPQSTLIAIDTFCGSIEHQPGKAFYEPEVEYLFDQYTRNLWDYRDRVIPMKASSIEGMRTLNFYGVKPTLIYIDASHLYEDVYADLSTAARLFHGAIITGDDYDAIRPNGVKKAVDNFCLASGYSIERHERFWRLCK